MSATKSTPNNDLRLLLRRAFGKFPTGVTITTARDASGSPIGFTANSFTSVSLDPPLLLVCLAKSSSNLENFKSAKTFAVNILTEDQKAESNRFASKVDDRFAETKWRETAKKTPIIEDSAAWFECAIENVIDAGDHVILLGRISDFGMSDALPLAYLNGHYLNLNLGEDAVNSVSVGGGVRVGCVLEHVGQILLQKDGDGWTLPMGQTAIGLREGRAALSKNLANLGVGANIGQLYSVFDAPKGKETWFVFLGDVESIPADPDLKLFPIDELPTELVKTKYFRSILGRFQSEAKHSRFGVYVDDAHRSGAIHDADRNVTPWTKFITAQENS